MNDKQGASSALHKFLQEIIDTSLLRLYGTPLKHMNFDSLLDKRGTSKYESTFEVTTNRSNLVLLNSIY